MLRIAIVPAGIGVKCMYILIMYAATNNIYIDNRQQTSDSRRKPAFEIDLTVDIRVPAHTECYLTCSTISIIVDYN